MKVRDLIAALSQFPTDAVVAIYDGDNACYVPVDMVRELTPREKRDLGLQPSDRVAYLGG